MNKMKTPTLLIPAEQAAHCQPFALTLDQRRFSAASKQAKQRLPDLAQAVETELSKLLTDVEFNIELTLCQGSALDSWLAEPGRLLLQCPVLVPTDTNCYLALDYTSVHHLADLSLGGQLSKVLPGDEKTELSASELRICSRIAQRQLQAMQQLLFKEQSALPASAIKQQMEPTRFQYLPLKVRLLLGSDVISWFLWLPLEFFIAPQYHSAISASAVDISPWPQVPVQCRVEMVRKKVSLRQLQACLDGAVLPIEFGTAMTLQLNQTALFLGKVAEEANSLVFQITDIVNKEKQA
jgi:flagellar motor switch/type III secretory pathway protein FliN